MSIIWLSLLLLVACNESCSNAGHQSKQRPNIILILADDLGWDDVGYHGSTQVETPVIDRLASQAVVLDSYYTNQLCTPSRAALLTGLYPIHTGLQHSVLFTTERLALPLKFPIMPQLLNPHGYKSHMVGKWHLGYYETKFTPTKRGFQSHLGYWSGEIGYYNHLSTDFMGEQMGLDFWDDLKLASNYSGQYSTDVFTDRAIRKINSHDTSQPLFLFLAYQSPHKGTETPSLNAPASALKRFAHVEDEVRRRICATIYVMDQSIGKIMESLRKRSMLSNSVVIFISDNGGEPAAIGGGTDGSNWPLRGGKATPWEGGVRVPAFVWSPLLQPRVSMQLFHVTDWLPTLLTAAAGANQRRSLKLDGISQWDSLLSGSKGPRTQLLHNIDKVSNFSSIRVGRYKLVQGAERQNLDQWFARPMQTKRKSTFVSTDLSKRLDCFPRKEDTACNASLTNCLFDIEEDPCERNNIADQNPGMAKRLLNMIQELQATALPAITAAADPRPKP